MKQFSEAFSKRLEGTGITRIQWIALYYIYESKNIYQRELSKCMYITDSSAGRLVDRLERDGLVRRVRSKKDKRRSYIELTEEGKINFEKVLPIGEKFNNNLTKNISNKELEIFNSVLNRMLLNVLEDNN